MFYVTRMDGVVDVWDYFYRQNEVAYSHKIGDCALSSISVQVQRLTIPSQAWNLTGLWKLTGG